MKRCPQCLFLYPDSDERCDFDQTPLEVVDDATIEAATNPPKPRKRRLLTIVIAAVTGLILAVLGIYIAMSRSTPDDTITPVAVISPTPFPLPPAVLPEFSPEPIASPSPSSTPNDKATTNGVTTTAHSRATVDPVSTSGPGIGSRQGGKPVIMLTSGGKIEADEVWRTKDGVWYRRNGMVTLLKRGQVKTIATR